MEFTIKKICKAYGNKQILQKVFGKKPIFNPAI